jgi:hypothetical protein
MGRVRYVSIHSLSQVRVTDHYGGGVQGTASGGTCDSCGNFYPTHLARHVMNHCRERDQPKVKPVEIPSWYQCPYRHICETDTQCVSWIYCSARCRLLIYFYCFRYSREDAVRRHVRLRHADMLDEFIENRLVTKRKWNRAVRLEGKKLPAAKQGQQLGESEFMLKRDSTSAIPLRGESSEGDSDNEMHTDDMDSNSTDSEFDVGDGGEPPQKQHVSDHAWKDPAELDLRMEQYDGASGTWSQPIQWTPKVPSPEREMSRSVSPGPRIQQYDGPSGTWSQVITWEPAKDPSPSPYSPYSSPASYYGESFPDRERSLSLSPDLRRQNVPLPRTKPVGNLHPAIWTTSPKPASPAPSFASSSSASSSDYSTYPRSVSSYQPPHKSLARSPGSKVLLSPQVSTQNKIQTLHPSTGPLPSRARAPRESNVQQAVNVTLPRPRLPHGSFPYYPVDGTSNGKPVQTPMPSLSELGLLTPHLAPPNPNSNTLPPLLSPHSPQIPHSAKGKERQRYAPLPPPPRFFSNQSGSREEMVSASSAGSTDSGY